MDHHRSSLQVAFTLCIVFLVTVSSESSPEVEYKLPLPTARAVRSEGQQKLQPDGDHPEYHFRYSVHNEDTGDIKSQEESRDGKSVVGRYTVAEPSGHVREVKYTADEKHGFRADVKIHPPGTFQTKNSEKRSADAEERSDSDEKSEEVQNDKSSEEEKEEAHADETKSSAELLHNDKPQQPEEMTDEEVEKTLEKQEHILNPQEHDQSSSDEEKSVDTEGHEQTDNLIITVNAEKKAPATEVKADATKQPVHITHAVKDPMAQPAYPFIPNFYSSYPYGQRIPHPALADSTHHIPHPAVADHHQFIPHPAVAEHQLRTPVPLPPPAPIHAPLNAGPAPAFLPSFIYHDHPISPVSPLFIQQPSQHAHHYLPGNVQDILAAKQASIQDVENMVRHASADDNKHAEGYGSHGYQIIPKPMMFQLADPPVHLLLPSNQFDQSYKALSYLAPNYPYNVPYVYQPSEGLGRAGLPQNFIDNRNQADEAQKSILSNFNNFNFVKPLVNNIPPQYLPEKFRPVSSTAAPLNADQVSSTAQPQTEPAQPHPEVQVNKGQTPAPTPASSPSPYFNFPFLYPLTTFLQRPFFHHQAQQAPQPLQTHVQQNQVHVQQDAEKVQKPAAPPAQSMAAPATNEQQRYYVIQPSFPTNGQYRYNPYNAQPVAPQHQQKSATSAVKAAPLRSQPAPTQVPAPQQVHQPAEKSSNLYSFPYNSPVAQPAEKSSNLYSFPYNSPVAQPAEKSSNLYSFPYNSPVAHPAEKSSNLYSFPYNSPVALLVLPMNEQQVHHTKINEGKGVKHNLDSYYKK